MHASTTIAIDSSSKAVLIKASAALIAEYAIHWTLCTEGTGGTRRWRFFMSFRHKCSCILAVLLLKRSKNSCLTSWMLCSLKCGDVSFLCSKVLCHYYSSPIRWGEEVLGFFSIAAFFVFPFFPSNPRKPVLSAPTCLANVQGAEAKLCVTYAPGKKKRAHYR
jgi:hypothetical protein